ncbi:MAG: gamma-glutamyl-gamma-aminobutyrate hydrolase family protein [Pseudomonadota bacterium]
MVPKPVIAVPCDRRIVPPHPFHMVGEKYVAALTDASDALPLLVPVLPDRIAIDAMLDRVDGVLLTGSPSDIEPKHYTDEDGHPDATRDPHRDALNLPLARRAIERGVPLFAICRGFQELNVSLGGTLHQKLSLIDGMLEHKENPADPLEVQYGPKHDVSLEPDGLIAKLCGKRQLRVNSLHGQGVRDLAPGLSVDARADDGLIEAYTVDAAKAFALAVQWHPEWQVLDNPDSTALFRAFGEACRDYHAR